MNRSIALGGVPLAVETPSETYGHMTVARWRIEGHARRDSRVFFAGEDVTDIAAEFDDREGWIELWRRDQNGQRYRSRARGPVEVRLGTRVADSLSAAVERQQYVTSVEHQQYATSSQEGVGTFHFGGGGGGAGSGGGPHGGSGVSVKNCVVHVGGGMAQWNAPPDEP